MKHISALLELRSNPPCFNRLLERGAPGHENRGFLLAQALLVVVVEWLQIGTFLHWRQCYYSGPLLGDFRILIVLQAELQTCQRWLHCAVILGWGWGLDLPNGTCPEYWQIVLDPLHYFPCISLEASNNTSVTCCWWLLHATCIIWPLVYWTFVNEWLPSSSMFCFGKMKNSWTVKKVFKQLICLFQSRDLYFSRRYKQVTWLQCNKGSDVRSTAW